MKQTVDSLASGAASWWQDWRGGGECLCDLGPVVMPPALASPAWSRPPSSPHSSGRMSPVCESPPPSPRTPPPLVPWLNRGAEGASLPPLRDDQRSLGLSSVKRDKNTYVAFPRTEVLQENVYYSLRPKKSFSFSSLRYPRSRRPRPEDSPIASRSASHDELPPPGHHQSLGSATCSCPDEDRLSVAGDRNSLVCLCPLADTQTPPPASRILPRARLRRRSIAAPGEFSLVSIVLAVV